MIEVQEAVYRILPTVRQGVRCFFVQRKRRFGKLMWWSNFADIHSMEKIICETEQEAEDMIKHLSTIKYYRK